MGAAKMLILSRKLGESVAIGESITVTVFKMKGNLAQLGIDAPEEIPILRSELQERAPDLEMPLDGTW
jgi:carbon storage regulator